MFSISSIGELFEKKIYDICSFMSDIAGDDLFTSHQTKVVGTMNLFLVRFSFVTEHIL